VLGQEKRLEAAKSGKVTWMPPPGLGKPFEDDESGAKKVLADGEKARRDEQAKAAGVVPGQGPRRKPRVNMEDIEDL